MHSYILVKSILYVLKLSLFIGEEQECLRIIKNVIFLRLDCFKIVFTSFSPVIFNRVCASLLHFLGYVVLISYTTALHRFKLSETQV